ncbi:MAG: FAD-dependent oxidoreductase [Verrucomicrobiota bacterium]
MMFLMLLCATAMAWIRAAEVIEADVCVYGGTSGGVASAVQSARLGRTTVLLEFGNHLGGMTSGGLGQTDIGNKGAIGGISREFYRRVGRHYGQEEQWIFEPHVAENIFFEMINEARVPVYFQQRIAKVNKEGARLREIVAEQGKVFRAKMFIDASYEGDLMARAGVSYHVGRESNATYNETLNGVRAHTPKHQFIVPVDPYVKSGDASSGLIPLIQSGDGGKPGEGDRAVQAYNFRLVLTQNPANRKAIEPPPKYDPNRYELLARYVEALVAAGKPPQLGDLMHIQMMPGGKTDINNNGGFSTDHIGFNYDYPEADYATRARLWKEHEHYTRGFLHFLATSPRLPESLRKEMQSWGLTRDEFLDTGGWPHQLYVREARRMISDYVMTEHNCRNSIALPDAIGLAAYTMDSHNCQRLVKNGRVENEGDVQVGGFPPYPIAYRSIVPKASECENLFVPVCLSASHIAFGSIRMEPVFMVLGHSAAVAANLAIEQQTSVQQVDTRRLQSILLEQKQILEWKPSRAALPPPAVDPKTLRGIVLDDRDAELKGHWEPSGSIAMRRVGPGYLHDGNASKGASSATYRPTLPQAGEYEIVLISPPHENRATNVPVTISTGSGKTQTIRINQRLRSHNGFASLGKFHLPKGNLASVTVSNEGTDGFVVVDGVQFIATP